MAVRHENKTLRDHIGAFGEDFGRVYNAVWNEWASGLVRYEELQEMFGTPEKIALLNVVEPGFFADVQQLFWHDLMLHVTRLTDKSKKAVKIQSLERFVKDEPELLKAVTTHRELAVLAAEPVKAWRNERIAHRSLSRALNRSPKPLAQVRLKTCKTVLDETYNVLEAIGLHYRNGGLINMVSYSPRSGNFFAYLKGLVEGVRFVDSIIRSGNPGSFDLEKGEAFLRKLGRSESGDSGRVLDIMKLARRLTRKT